MNCKYCGEKIYPTPNDCWVHKKKMNAHSYWYCRYNLANWIKIEEQAFATPIEGMMAVWNTDEIQK